MRWKNFGLQFWSSNATTANVLVIQPKHADQNKNVSSAERTISVKNAQIEKQGNQNALTVKGHMLHLTKGVWNTKEHAFRKYVVDNPQKYASIVSQKTFGTAAQNHK